VSARTILVTEGEQRAALALVRSLGRAGHRVHVASRDGRSLAGASRYAVADHATPDPLASPHEHVATLRALVTRLGVDVLVPVTEASLAATLGEREQLGAIVPFPSFAAFAAISDKARLLAEAPRVGIAAPAATEVQSAAEAKRRAGELHFPVVVKPSRSVRIGEAGAQRSKHDVRHAADAGELTRVLDDLPAGAFPALIQQRIVGPGIGVFLLLWEGKVLARFAHRRLREKPPSGGVSVYSESVAASEELFARSEALLRRFDWSGVAMVEYKLDAATGTPYLMEVNGRFWGSLQLAIEAGVDFPRLLIAAATGDPLPAVMSYRIGVRNRWWWGDVDQLLTRIRRSRRRLSLPPGMPGRLAALGEFVAATFRPGNNEVFRVDDPKPFVHETLNWICGR